MSQENLRRKAIEEAKRKEELRVATAVREERKTSSVRRLSELRFIARCRPR